MNIGVAKWLARIRVKNVVGRGWWSIFGIGVLLGAVIFGMKVTLMEVDARPNITAASYHEEGGWKPTPNPTQEMLALPPLAAAPPRIDSPDSPNIDTVQQNSKADQPRIDSPNRETMQKNTEVNQPLKEIGMLESVVDSPSNNVVKLDEEVDSSSLQYSGALDGTKIRVYLTGKKRVETVPIETYVMGVIAGEMPIDFHLEALKAQAVAARTYIVRRLLSRERVEKADVLDTVQHQVYISQKELAKRWAGEEKARNLEKLQRAVEETKGLIVTYQGKPIEASFFSTSNGYTENSEEYWEKSLPYLRSVASPWDRDISPRYEQQFVFKRAAIYRALGISGNRAKAKLIMKVTERTDGKRIKEIEINGKSFSGREVRERLGIASSEFEWKIEKDKVIITTYGSGHGVGMSQWGANGMAQNGRSAKDILLHYYSDTVLEQASKLPI